MMMQLCLPYLLYLLHLLSTCFRACALNRKETCIGDCDRGSGIEDRDGSVIGIEVGIPLSLLELFNFLLTYVPASKKGFSYQALLRTGIGVRDQGSMIGRIEDRGRNPVMLDLFLDYFTYLPVSNCFFVGDRSSRIGRGRGRNPVTLTFFIYIPVPKGFFIPSRCPKEKRNRHRGSRSRIKDRGSGGIEDRDRDRSGPVYGFGRSAIVARCLLLVACDFFPFSLERRSESADFPLKFAL